MKAFNPWRALKALIAENRELEASPEVEKEILHDPTRRKDCVEVLNQMRGGPEGER